MPNSEKEVHLFQIFKFVFSKKIAVAIVFSSTFLISAYWTFSLPNIYRSTALLIPSHTESGGAASFGSNVGALASLAGINLGSGSGNKSLIAIETIRSRQFLVTFIRNRSIEAELFAAEGWDAETDSLIYDGELYDPVKSEWLQRGVVKVYPSDEQLYKVLSRVLSVSEDSKSGLVQISLDFYSPVLAQRWLQLLISDVNKLLKEKDLKEIDSNINYLESLLPTIQSAEIRSSFFNLLQEQMKNKMLTNSKDEYAFSTIDPPNLPEKKFAPGRLIIVLGVTALVTLLFITFLIVGYLIRLERIKFKSRLT